MVRTVVVQIVIDENNNSYEIGNRVRVKMKPSNAEMPEWANEYIGWIDDITEDAVIVATTVGMRRLDVNRIDKIRFAAEDESFDNKWDF